MKHIEFRDSLFESFVHGTDQHTRKLLSEMQRDFVKPFAAHHHRRLLESRWSLVEASAVIDPDTHAKVMADFAAIKPSGQPNTASLDDVIPPELQRQFFSKLPDADTSKPVKGFKDKIKTALQSVQDAAAKGQLLQLAKDAVKNPTLQSLALTAVSGAVGAGLAMTGVPPQVTGAAIGGLVGMARAKMSGKSWKDAAKSAAKSAGMGLAGGLIGGTLASMAGTIGHSMMSNTSDHAPVANAQHHKNVHDALDQLHQMAKDGKIHDYNSYQAAIRELTQGMDRFGAATSQLDMLASGEAARAHGGQLTGPAAAVEQEFVKLYNPEAAKGFDQDIQAVTNMKAQMTGGAAPAFAPAGIRGSPVIGDIGAEPAAAAPAAAAPAAAPAAAAPAAAPAVPQRQELTQPYNFGYSAPAAAKAPRSVTGDFEEARDITGTYNNSRKYESMVLGAGLARLFEANGVSVDDLYIAQKKAGYTDEQIKSVFAKYGLELPTAAKTTAKTAAAGGRIEPTVAKPTTASTQSAVVPPATATTQTVPSAAAAAGGATRGKPSPEQRAKAQSQFKQKAQTAQPAAAALIKTGDAAIDQLLNDKLSREGKEAALAMARELLYQEQQKQMKTVPGIRGLVSRLNADQAKKILNNLAVHKIQEQDAAGTGHPDIIQQLTLAIGNIKRQDQQQMLLRDLRMIAGVPARPARTPATSTKTAAAPATPTSAAAAAFATDLRNGIAAAIPPATAAAQPVAASSAAKPRVRVQAGSQQT